MGSEIAVRGDVAVQRMDSGDSWERKWGVWDQIRFLAMIVLWVAAWIARTLLVFLPQQHSSGILGLIDHASKSSTLFSAADDQECDHHNLLWTSHAAGGLAKSAIGRALSQVLQLVNEIPASSRKYEFSRGLADKMIHDNLHHGSRALRDVNRIALEAGFSRTIYLLNNSLEGLHRQQQVQAWSWPWKLLKSLPLASIPLPILGTLKSRLGNLQQQLVVSPALAGHQAEDSETAEKLAQELLWMSQRLKENDALELAIIHWGSASSLACQSVCANPRVQRLLVKLSAFLCAGLVAAEEEAPSEVTLKVLLLWIPLFCRSSTGIDATVFTSAEKHEAERVLERTIRLLPSTEQELVLGLWLNEFAHSSSDWPNLQSCYDGWCYATRKINYVEDGSVEMLLEDLHPVDRMQLVEDHQKHENRAVNVLKAD